MAPPNADDVRLSPPVRRCHHLAFVSVALSVILVTLSLMRRP